jgi:hypothetical protein
MAKVLKQTFKYTAPDGGEVVNFDTWAGEALSQEEYNAWFNACRRQNEIIKSKENDDKLSIDGDEYYWDENTVKYEQPCDQEWLEFWNRYLDETGIEFESMLEDTGINTDD